MHVLVVLEVVPDICDVRDFHAHVRVHCICLYSGLSLVVGTVQPASQDKPILHMYSMWTDL